MWGCSVVLASVDVDDAQALTSDSNARTLHTSSTCWAIPSSFIASCFALLRPSLIDCAQAAALDTGSIGISFAWISDECGIWRKKRTLCTASGTSPCYHPFAIYIALDGMDKVR